MRRLLTFFSRTRVRLTLWYVFLLAGVLIVFSGALYVSLRSSLMSDLDSDLKETSGQLVTSIVFNSGPLGLNAAPLGDLMDQLASQGFAVRLFNDQGAMLEAFGPYKEVFAHRAVFTNEFTTNDIGGTRWRVYSTEMAGSTAGSRLILQVAEPLNRVESTLSRLLVIEILSIPVVLLVAIALGMFMSGRALRPVERIADLAASTSAMDLSRRLDLDLPDDEIGRLAKTFDDMLGRLDEAFTRQRRFVSEAAHELRTPLTIIKGTTDVTLSRPRTSGEYREALEELRGEIDHLVGLDEDLLLLARSDSDAAALDMQDLDLDEVARKAVDLIAPLARQNGMTVEFRSPGPVPFHGDPKKLTRIFLNGLDNAVKYSPAGSTVHFSVTGDDHGIVAEIRDAGPGMTDDEVAQIFDRFHRSDEARQKNPSGSGLGLPIARWLAVAHGGEIVVESQPGAGTTFRLLLPPPVESGEH